MIKFNNHFESPVKVLPTIYEKVDTVERAGYVPLRNQIQAYKEAGVLLRATRALQFDTPNAKAGFDGLDKAELFTCGGVDYSDMSELVKRSQALYKANQLRSGSSSSASAASSSAKEEEAPISITPTE